MAITGDRFSIRGVGAMCNISTAVKTVYGVINRGTGLPVVWVTYRDSKVLVGRFSVDGKSCHCFEEFCCNLYA